MNLNAVLASLCYLSVFFAPFLFPIIVYFVVESPDVKQAAKLSFLSHLIPLASIPVLFFYTMASGFHWSSIVVSIIIYGLISLVVFIWNVVRGIQSVVRNGRD
ncbi:MAG TPA: hypothetical protein VFK44_01045 [Bacillales bacterium]|nr:hypothetical protein [Bacillales bacterium]